MNLFKLVEGSGGSNVLKKINVKKKIKFIKSGFYLVIVTEDNEIYLLLNNFKKIEQHFGIINHLENNSNYSLIVNNKNEIYIFGKIEELHDSNNFTKFNYDLKENIKLIRGGIDYIFIVTKDNCLYGIGNNRYDQIGIKELTLVTKFTKIKHFSSIKDLQCGYFHSILLDTFGDIYITGWNNFGDFKNRTHLQEFTKIELPFKVIQISCFNNGSLILSEDFELYGTGKNNYGQLGTGDYENRYNFMKIVLDFKVKNIYLSWSFFNIVTDFNNRVYITGFDSYNRLGYDIPLYSRYLNLFTKIDFEPKKNYIEVLIHDRDIYLIESDYLVNRIEEYHSLKLKLFEKAINCVMCDIFFVLDNYTH